MLQLLYIQWHIEIIYKKNCRKRYKRYWEDTCRDFCGGFVGGSVHCVERGNFER